MTDFVRVLARVLIAGCCAFGAGGSALAGGPADSPAYAEATAHDPKYDDRSLWPAWVEKTDFIKQEWSKARVLVWAKTEGRMRNLEMSDPEYWLEDGAPEKKGPDENTDIVVPSPPASARRGYMIHGEPACPARHVTVEPGVRVGVRMFSVYGNVWVKRGASFSHIRLGGGANTFMRSDDEKPNFAANKIAFNRPPDNSVEWIGCWLVNDELDLFSGRFIVAPDSTFLPGDRSSQRIYPKAELILLSGSTFEKRAVQFALHDVQVTGELLVGTAERPLTRDATLGLCAKLKKTYLNAKPSHIGLVLYKEGRIAVHSTDPEQARLVIRRNTRPPASNRVPAELEKDMAGGLEMLLLGETALNGVEFRDVLRGGIRMPDPNAAGQWESVKIAGGRKLDDLLTKYEGDGGTMDDRGIAGTLIRKMKKQEQEKAKE